MTKNLQDLTADEIASVEALHAQTAALFSGPAPSDAEWAEHIRRQVTEAETGE
jgi:hypothetical protein